MRAEHVGKALLALFLVLDAQGRNLAIVIDFAAEQRNLELAVEGKLAEIVLLNINIYIVHREGETAD